MSVLSDLARDRVGSLARLARDSGIPESMLRDFGDGHIEPDRAHVRRIRKALGDLPDDLFPHQRPQITYLNVTDVQVLAKRDEHLVRPHQVRSDDLIRLVTTKSSGGEAVEGWVKVKSDAVWVNGTLVEFALKDDSVVQCHPAQVVTVARRRDTVGTNAS